jgi:hypothetical protein
MSITPNIYTTVKSKIYCISYESGTPQSDISSRLFYEILTRATIPLVFVSGFSITLRGSTRRTVNLDINHWGKYRSNPYYNNQPFTVSLSRSRDNGDGSYARIIRPLEPVLGVLRIFIFRGKSVETLTLPRATCSARHNPSGQSRSCPLPSRSNGIHYRNNLTRLAYLFNSQYRTLIHRNLNIFV